MTVIRARSFTRMTQDSVKALDPYEDLAERMARALDDMEASTTDAVKHAPAGSPIGGQFVAQAGGGSGSTEEPAKSAKPLSAKAKTAKGKLHELLSSGHAFSKAELMEIAGITNASSFTSWISMFKSDTKAGAHGKLDIKKMPDGSYQVVKVDGEPASPATAAPMPDLLSAEPAITTNLPKGKANEAYDEHMADALFTLTSQTEGIAQFSAKPLEAVESYVLKYKQAKAQGMANWANSVHGNNVKPVPQQIFESDKILAKKIHEASIEHMGDEEAFAEAVHDATLKWKLDTVLEKKGKLPSTAKPITPQVSNAPKPAVTLENVWDKPAPKDYSTIVPKSFKHITTSDLKAGSKGMRAQLVAFKALLAKESTTASGNKATLENQLINSLADKPNFQAIKKLMPESVKSLENRLIGVWAASSGDGNPISNALQLAVRDGFGIPSEHIETKALSAISDHGEDKVVDMAALQMGITIKGKTDRDTFKAGLQEFVHAQYDNTQALLKEHGLDHVFVARGMKFKVDHEATQDVTDVKLQPASSFSANYNTAKAFAGTGTVFFTKVPRSQVLSTYKTGFGCTSEHEVVVLGHEKVKAFALPYNSQVSTLEDAVASLRNNMGVKV